MSPGRDAKHKTAKAKHKNAMSDEWMITYFLSQAIAEVF
jgi:hypothetical protein